MLPGPQAFEATRGSVGQPRLPDPVYGKHLAAIIHSSENRAEISAATETPENKQDIIYTLKKYLPQHHRRAA